MFLVKYGKEHVHDPRRGLYVTSAELEVEVNTSSTLSFVMQYDHPLYDELRERDTDNPISVWQDDVLIFYGDVLSIKTEFRLSKTVECRGILGWLNDSIVRPYSTLASECDNVAPNNPAAFFQWLIDSHNEQVEDSKRFKVDVNEAQSLDGYFYHSDSSYTNTGKTIQEKLLEDIGGYVVTKQVDGENFIDYIADFPDDNAQIIDFGVNLLDYSATDTTDDLATFVVPVGKQIQKENAGENEVQQRVNLSSVSDGYPQEGFCKKGDIIYSIEAVKKYGWIGALVTFDDVEVASNLLDKGVLALKELMAPVRTIEVKAIDLAWIDPDAKPIYVGQYVRVRSKPHNFDSYMLCTKIKYDLNAPDNNTFTLGTTFDVLTGIQNKRINALNANINAVYEEADHINADIQAMSLMMYSVRDVANAAQEAAYTAQSTASEASTKSDAAVEAASNAQTVASEAKTTADEAAAAANEAATVANDAKTEADAAAQTATEAQQKADAAQTKVNSVEESVTVIQTDVAAAQAAAETAQQKANEADSKAVEAQTAASNAKTDANVALTAAQAAQTTANSATDKANAAQTAASEAQTAAAGASTTAAAAKADAEQANKDIAALGEELETVSNTMTADYARKTDLTEATASLQTQITQNAAGIKSNATKITTVDETANDAADKAAAAQTAASTAQSTADAATADAAAAQTKADQAAAAAATAQSNADTANAAAAAAQAKANEAAADLATAEQNLANVTSRVDSTEEDIAAAQQAVTDAKSAADKAQADATAAATKAATAQTTADNAATAASTAQTAADDAVAQAKAAQKAADDAGKAAQAAQAKADQAAVDAAAAQSTANTAKTNAATAQSKADQAAATAAAAQTAADEADAKAAQAAADLTTAEQNLANVTSRVDATEEEIAAAQKAVETAQAAADKAKADAATAQSTANTAKTNAANAQTAANNAKAAADAAQADADAAQAAADKAQSDVDALAVRVTTAETNISQNAEAIELRATKTEVTETLGGYYTKEEADAAIKVSADSITQTVSETYTTKEELDNAASEVQGSTDDLAERVTASESVIEQLSDSIASMVRSGDETSLVKQDESGLYYFDIAALQESADATAENLGDLLATLGEFNLEEGETLLGKLAKMESALDAVGLKTEYVTVGTYEDEPCIILGESDSEFKLLITNTRIVFQEGSTDTTYIKDNTLVTNNIEVEDEIRQGQWRWMARDNGNLGLIWIGGK